METDRTGNEQTGRGKGESKS